MLVLAVFRPPVHAQLAPDGNEEPRVGESQVRVNERGRVEIHVQDVPLATVLQLLSLQSRKNIVASPKVQGRVTASLFEVTFDEALTAVLLANNAGHRTSGNFVYVYTKDELADIDAAANRRPTTRVFRLNYVSAADAKAYLLDLLGEDGLVTTSAAPETGLASSNSSAGGQTSAAQDFILVTARPEKLAEAARLLEQIDVRPRQVLVEATILRAELTDDNAMGIDFSLVGGVDLELLGATSNGLASINLGQLPTERFEQFNALASTNFVKDVPGGGITVGIVKDNVAVFVRALEQFTDTTVLANPKVLALNKQKGQVIVGRRDGFLTTTVTETQAVQSVEFLETGTQLIFRPFVADDGYVRVELHPEDSVGFVNAQGLPSEQTTEVTTNVLIRDGETILIGGLFREVTTDARSQIPGLGSLPWVGTLFRSKEDSTAREEVIILLTIHVIKDQYKYVASSTEHWERIERMRAGLRKGLMWSGRDRLAERHYQKALEALTAHDPDKALWHARLALHNNGRMAAAIELRDKLTRSTTWDEDGSIAREFIHRLIAEERGYHGPLMGRPAPPFDVPASAQEPKEAQPAEDDRGPASPETSP